MTNSKQPKSLKATITSVVCIISFTLVGLFYLGLCYVFGVGTGMFGVQNTWDSEMTTFLIFGLLLLTLAVINPIRSRNVALASTMLLLGAGIISIDISSDTMPIFLVLLVIMWVMYFIRNKSKTTS